jgi:CheY-like chemotaxis protein
MPAKILVVDDELSLRLFIAAVFETAGYVTATAKNGAEGTQKAREMRPDLISLDLMMPGQGGLKMYRELKADPELAKVPVMVVSAVSGKTFGHAMSSLSVGLGTDLPPPDAYLEKPPSPETLLAEARRLLGGDPQ